MNRFSSNTAFCNFHLSGLSPFKEYQLVYYRKAPNTGKLITLQKTKKFKIVPKQSIKGDTSFEYTIIYEDNLQYNNEQLAKEFFNYSALKSASHHKKHAKSLAETVTTHERLLLNLTFLPLGNLLNKSSSSKVFERFQS